MARSNSKIRFVLMGEWLPVAPAWLKVLIDLWLIGIAVGVLSALVGSAQLTGIMFPLWALRLWYAWSRRSDHDEPTS